MSFSSSSSTSKKPSLSLCVSPSSPPLPSSSQLPSLTSSSAPTTRRNSKSRDLSPTSTSRNHLSTSTYYPSYSNSNSNPNESTPNDRRITSWGSAVSLSQSTNSLNFSTNLNGLNGEEMTSLPSPLVGPSSGAKGREWNARGSTSSNISNLGESISGGNVGGLNDYEDKGFRFNESSVFSELRESTSRPSSSSLSRSNSNSHANTEETSQDYQNQSTSRSNGGSFSSISSQPHSLQPLTVQSRNPSITSEDLPTSSLHRYPSTKSNASRTPSGRSKTLSFFDSDFTSGNSASGGGGISPPPNPLSRNSSLNTSIRDGSRAGGERNWLDEDEVNSKKPGLERRPSHESPEHSPTLTSIPQFSRSNSSDNDKKYHLPKLPNLPPLLVPFPNSNWSTSNSNNLASSSDSGPSLISPTYSSYSSSSSNNNNNNNTSNRTNSTNSPNLMSTLPTAISPPKNYKTRFDPPPQSPPIISTSQISTPTLTSPSQQQQHLFETLNSNWNYLDSPSIQSNNLPPIDFQTMQIIPPTPTLNSTTSLSPEEEKQEEDREPEKGDRIGEWEVVKLLGKGSFSRVALAKGKLKDLKGGDGEKEELVALKMILRKSYEGNERMRISVVREVEVLKHIHHPSLTTLLASFSTPIYTVLVLDYSQGGELFDFLSDWHSKELEGSQGEGSERGEELIRRIFGEVCDAVDWMHSIGLVHRDIKLENILLTSRPFPNNLPSTTSILTILPTPFVKLTDFGLSRFIPLPTSSSSSSPSSNSTLETHSTQLLTTRCGSESYAAPELIMGRKYDGRKTDSWALGVVLFALGSGEMPFVEDLGDKGESGLDESLGAGGGGRSSGRKAFLMRIAKGEFYWPDEVYSDLSRSTTTTLSTTPSTTTEKKSYKLLTPSFKSLVSKFLTRDSNKRLIVGKVWEEDWFLKDRETGEMRNGTPVRVKGWVGGRN